MRYSSGSHCGAIHCLLQAVAPDTPHEWAAKRHCYRLPYFAYSKKMLDLCDR